MGHLRGQMYAVEKNSYACGGFQTTVCTCADCLLFGTADTYYGTVDTVRHVVVSLLIACCMLQRIPTYVRTPWPPSLLCPTCQIVILFVL